MEANPSAGNADRTCAGLRSGSESGWNSESWRNPDACARELHDFHSAFCYLMTSGWLGPDPLGHGTHQRPGSGLDSVEGFGSRRSVAYGIPYRANAKAPRRPRYLTSTLAPASSNFFLIV